MWLKKCTCFLLACVAVFGCLFTPVAAAELGEQKVEIEERRASGKFDFDIPAKTLMKASSSFPMEYGETVTITASYNDNLQTTTIETNDGVIFEIKDGVEDSFVGGMRRDSYIAVDSSLNDKSGSQTIPFRTNSDYPYYRVFVSNTSKTSYNITLTDASGKNQLTSSPITLGAGRHTNITNSNAASGMRYLTVTAQDGSALDGTVRIRLASSADELANG